MYVLTLLTVSCSELKASAKYLNCKYDFTQLKKNVILVQVICLKRFVFYSNISDFYNVC